MSDTLPVPRPLLLRLLPGVVGVVVFLVVSTVHGAVLPEFDAWHQSVSALALAPYGSIQVLNFWVLGSSLLSTVPTWRRVLRGGTGARAYPALTLLLGLSFFLVGCLPQDPAPGYDPAGLALQAPTLPGLLHLAGAGVAAAASVALMLIVASRLSADPHWRGWTTYTRVLAALTVGCIIIYGVWSTQPTGWAGTFERLAIVVPAMWGVHFLYHLWRGRPFLRA